MDIFSKYVEKRIFKSLAAIDFFKEDYWQEDLLCLLEQAFQSSSDYAESLTSLEPILNDKGLKTFRTRYAKYKSAHKRRTDKKTIEISQDILEKITQAMALNSADTYDELFERLLDRSDHLISSIMAENRVINSYPLLYKALPDDVKQQFSNKLETSYLKGFKDGVNSIPIDARKKANVLELSQQQLEQDLAMFKRQLHD